MSFFHNNILIGSSGETQGSPTFIAATTGFNTSGSSITLTTPTGTQNGDFMVVVIATAPNSSNFNVGSFGNIGTTISGTPTVKTAKLKLSSAPSASYSFSWTTGGYHAAILATFRNADDGNINVNGTYTSSSGSAADCGSITTTVANTMVLCVAAVLHGNNGPSAPTGYTQIARLGSGGSGSGVGVGMHYKIYPNTGSTGSVITGSAGVNDVYVGGLRSIIFA